LISRCGQMGSDKRGTKEEGEAERWGGGDEVNEGK